MGAGLMVSLMDRVIEPSHVLVRVLDKESVLLNLETERYFGLDETGTRMWQLVTAAPKIEVAYRQLLDEYDVEPERLRENLTDLLGRLVENGLLQVVPSDVGTGPTISSFALGGAKNVLSRERAFAGYFFKLEVARISRHAANSAGPVRPLQ
jgi:Coenzyme PQQ synthesis protein D (PqqD)